MIDKAAEIKVTKAKIQLILDQPFFAILALNMPYEQATEAHGQAIDTAATDGKRIIYNPDFINSLTVDEIKGLIAHEVTHVTSLHHTRRAGREMQKWNVACDYAINPLIVQSKLQLPKGALIDPKFTGMSAEEIFNLLPDSPSQPNGPGQGPGNPGNDPGQCGGIMDSQAKTQSERAQEEAQVKQQISRAAIMAKQQGNLPGHLERLINEVLQPRVNWKEVLQRFCDQIQHNDYTWAKPNSRYSHLGLYLPAMESIAIGKFILMIDTSGSVDQDLLNEFGAEVSEIAQAWNIGFTVLHIDDELAHVQEFEHGDTIEAKGGGGTDFRPGFNWIADQGEEEPSAVIYFTDGWCNRYPETAPNYPVLWGVYGSHARTFSPPFGEVIAVTAD